MAGIECQSQDVRSVHAAVWVGTTADRVSKSSSVSLCGEVSPDKATVCTPQFLIGEWKDG